MYEKKSRIKLVISPLSNLCPSFLASGWCVGRGTKASGAQLRSKWLLSALCRLIVSSGGLQQESCKTLKTICVWPLQIIPHVQKIWSEGEKMELLQHLLKRKALLFFLSVFPNMIPASSFVHWKIYWRLKWFLLSMQAVRRSPPHMIPM